jgi:hypothetical protein
MPKEIKTPDHDYEVGYGKPPKSTQFAKGESGNPSGRPKGKRNMATFLHAALYETVVITENGTRKSIPKFEAAIKQLVNKSASGDNTSLKLLIQLVPALDTLNADTGIKVIDSEADKQVMLNMQKRLLKISKKTNATDKEENPS